MATTYDGDPSANVKDWLRFQLGDTDVTDAIFTDEEISAIAGSTNNYWSAASSLAYSAAGKFARRIDASISGTASFKEDQLFKHYKELADQFKRNAQNDNGGPSTVQVSTPAYVGPYVGGISIAEMDNVESDTDRVPPPFTRGAFDYPGGVPDSTQGRDTWDDEYWR